MKIIQATLDDIFTLQQIGKETYQQHFSHLWTNQGMEQFLNQDFSTESLKASLTDQHQLWFLLLGENHVAQGFAKINLNKYDINLKQTATELQKIYLLETAIKNNYSHTFFQFILNDLYEKNYKFIYLEVLSNNIRAQKFYKKYHFKEKLEIPYSTDLYHIGMKIMTLTLSS